MANKFSESFLASIYQTFNNKFLFISICILQLLFFGILLFIGSVYSTNIVDNSKAISEYFEQQQIDETQMAKNILEQKSIFGDDPLMIARNYEAMKKSFFKFLVLSYAASALFISVLWAMTFKIAEKGFKIFSRKTLEIFIVAATYLGAVFLLIFFLTDVSLLELSFQLQGLLTKLLILAFFSVALIYFMLVSLALLTKAKLKELAEKAIILGVRKFHYFFLVFLINLVLISMPLFLLSISIESSPFVMSFSILLLAFSISFGRVFFINVVKRISD